jgi:hypothetical protein
MDEALLTIKEAVIFTGKCERTIYRYIKKGKLPCQTVVSQMSDSSQAIVRVKKSDLIRVFNVTSDTCQTDVRQKPDSSQTPVRDFKEDIKTAIEEVLEAKQSQLMRPIEEQALYRCGILENEVKHLHAEKETLRQENEVLREQVKSLPDKASIDKIQAENQEKEKYLMIQIELERQEKADLLSRGETIRKEQEELHRQELEQVKKEAEEREKAVIEECKRQLREYMNKPWYRKLFS